MDWIRDNTLAFIFIVVFGAAIIVVVIASVVAFAVQGYKNRKRNALKNYTYGAELDLKNNRVIYFERREFADRRTVSIDSFLSNFHRKDVHRVKLWLDEIKRNFDVADEYFEAEVVNKSSDGYFFLMKAVAYNEEKQILYLECRLLSMINPSQGRKRATNSEYSVIKRSQIEAVYDAMTKKRGVAYSIRFFYKNNDVINDTSLDKSILYRLKNEVCLLALEDKSNRYIFDEYDDQIYLFDFKLDSDQRAEQFAKEIENKLQSFLKIKAYVQTHGFAIGVVNFTNSNYTLDETIKKASQTSEAARVNEVPCIISNDGTEALATFDNSFVEKIFNRDYLKLLYRPIINVKTEQTVGYISNVKCLETQFNNYFEIARYINRVDRNEELLSKVLRRFVSKFYYEKPNAQVRLYVQISLVDLDHLGKILTNIPQSKDVNLVLMFEESEVNANAFSLDLLVAQLKELMSMGYEIALLLKDENTLLEHEFYSVFNYFVIGSSMVSKIKDNNRARLSNKFLIESLLQYKRPIIITDLDGWSSIDLFIKSGCTFLSGDDISPSSEMILPIEKTKIARLRKINN